MMKKYCLLLLVISFSITKNIQSASAADDSDSKLNQHHYKSFVRAGTSTESVENFNIYGNLEPIPAKIEFGFYSANNARNGGYSNQDAASIGSYGEPDAPVFIFTVCDGHGDEPEATRIAQSVTFWWLQSLFAQKEESGLDWNMQQIYFEAAKDVQHQSELVEGQRSAGTTMTSVIFYVDQNKQPQAIFSNVGDSRSLLVRKGKSIYATTDHKPGEPTEKDRIEKAGGIVVKPHQDRDFYRINSGSQLAVSRTFGDSKDRPFVIEEPTNHKMETVEKGDYFVLATDGFWDIVDNKKIAKRLKIMEESNQSLQDFVTEIVQEIGSKKSRTNPEQYKQKDDITLLVVKVK
ncbi:MAG: protein serine/threonine phosphatase 2C family protein [Proteobacteria bacterium]|nr:protein serine/threonine phosphatase 2C family protein [Pseudomonadota bacterium]NBP16469.1 protein serine/threonine phosphatase 2C family protein [bacterium]